MHNGYAYREIASYLAMTRGVFQHRHAELVSAPHLQSRHYSGDLSCGVLKQVQDDVILY